MPSEGSVQKEPDKKPDSALPDAPAKSGGNAADVVFNDSITIQPSKRLPQYDQGPIKAYAAEGTDKAPSRLIAYICEDHLTPRTIKASNVASIMNPSLARLVASGVTEWPMVGKEKYCFVYENNLGNPLVKDDAKVALGIKPEIVLNTVIRPLIGVLADMRDRDMVHGNIRLSNIYDGGMKTMERAILGDCLTTPPSYNQPVLYEPIDRAMCSPIGRGVGSQQDDLYSLGVCLALMMRHSDPSEGVSGEKIVEAKMEEGSYAFLLANDRLSGAILELMRGLLYDDENQRWNIDEVLQWLDGRRLSPKQTARRSKAARPLLFNGEKYTRPELIARDLYKNVSESRLIVENGDMEQWLSRALEDKMCNNRYEKALRMASEDGKGANYAEQLATRVSIALNPHGPIRYKSISVMPEGVGTAVTEAYMMKRDVQTYHDFFMHYFITQWVDAQSGSIPDVGNLISKFDGARAYLRNKGVGMGLERCLYALNPEVHCLSEKLQKYHVRSPEDMMLAFEKMSRSPDRPVMFFDRHSTAFISVKDRKNIDPYLHDLNLPETWRRVLAEAKILASIQKRSQMERFPGIAAWIVDSMESVYERFHDRELRADLKKKAQRAVDAGDLSKVVYLFDNPAIYNEDNTAFRKAMRTYYDLEQESVDIERSLLNEGKHGREAGHQVAALVSAGLSLLIILFSIFGAG